MNSKVRAQLFKWLVKARYSFTGVGSAVGIMLLFVLYSMGIVIEPNSLVWASAFVIGGGVGLGVDEIQNKLSS